MWRTEHHLYPYQTAAALTMCSRNALLAFEMGTGKTPTTLWAIEQLRDEEKITGTGTIVVPSSLKYQWAAEIRKFTDQDVIVIDGPPKKRYGQYAAVDALRPGYMVMSYDSIVRDWAEMKGLGTAFLVLDEATAIKAFDTKRSKHLKKIAHRYRHRFALTGTPIENGKLEELFSIMQWVDEDVLGKWPKFERAFIVRNPFGWIERYKNVGMVHERLTSTRAMLRATHKQPEVARYLPEVVERPEIKVPLSKGAQKIADEIARRILDDLDEFAERLGGIDFEAMQKQDWSHPDGKMMAKITVLRQFLSDPQAILVNDTPFVDQLLEDGILRDKAMTGRGDKMEALFDYLKDFFEAQPDGKAVVFCSYVNTAERIHSAFLPYSTLLTGRMSAKERAANVERFRKRDDTGLFVSTDAGGYGLDLPEAQLLINFDLPWAPGVLAQRNARIKRASSEWEYVVIQNLVCEGTIEERMLEMLRHKMAIADAVVDGTGTDERGQLASDLDSLRSFLHGTVAKELNHAT